MKFVVTLLLASIALAALLLNHASTTARSVETSTSARSETIVASQQQTGLIDGSVHPELIPDRAAYSVLFRLIGNRQTAEEKSRIRAYIRQIGFSDADGDGLIAAAEDFQQRVSALDAEAKQIKANNRGPATPALKAQLLRLQQQKESIVDHLVVTLPQRLSRDGVSRLEQHIAERVKRHVRFQPN